jgi:myo-inositol-1(or 4)-monophosphatase
MPPLIPGPGAVHGELQAAGLDYARGPHFSSLAYRLVQVATGDLDAVPVRRGASDWDIAGAAAILAECGIEFEDVCMGALRFNRQGTRHGALAAIGDKSLKGVLQQALIRVYGCPPEEAVATSDLESRTT